MKNKYNHRGYCTPYQLKLPLEISKKIKISDPVYTFCEVFDHIDLNKHLAVKESRIGRKRYDSEILLKVILFAFMEFGYVSTREIERLCNNDIRFMWLLQDNPAPSHMTIDNFMKNYLVDCINDILDEINSYIFEMENVDLSHIYIDGTKIVANANRYSWVWKKSSKKNRQKTFNKITALFQEINSSLIYQDVEFEIRTEYPIEYMELIIDKYINLFNIQPECIVRGRGHHKTAEQRTYDKLVEYTEKLKKYAIHINTCGDNRNSYSKTDNDATFFRMKRDYMGNDQLLPGYNIQLGVCDEYIAVADIKQYASDTDCFIPLMEKFKKIYGFYPKYPVADAGYGSFNNYLYCEEHGMEKYMKFTMFEKESKDEKYRDNPYRAVNFPINKNGKPVCPNGKEFNFLYTRPVKGNKYSRTEELYQCEDCSNCEHKEKCCKAKGDRIIRLNEELTSVHQEVLSNLNSTKGALLRMNRSIQAEGAFGTIKWNRAYTRAKRRGLKGINLEILMICCGFNLHKYHLKSQSQQRAA